MQLVLYIYINVFKIAKKILFAKPHNKLLENVYTILTMKLDNFKHFQRR